MSLWLLLDFDFIRVNMILKYIEFLKGLNYKDLRFNDNRYYLVLFLEKFYYIEEKY